MYESGVAELYRNCFHHVTGFEARKLRGMSANSSGSDKRPDLPISKYPGERFRLPEKGPRSVARVGRRIIALVIDWLMSSLIVSLLMGANYFELLDKAITASENMQKLNDPQTQAQMQQASDALVFHQTLVGVTFVLLQVLALWTIGGSIGHRIMGMYLVNVRGGSLTWWRPIVRSLLLVLVIPALVWDSDQRGFHDKIAGTILLSSR
ncbi:MAG: hypothetical protein RL720_403 [Actinomycetota bacterium]|jgi:uncharacterized RDD family membrane protein YckC